MSAEVDSGEPRQNGRPHARPSEEDGRTARQAWCGQQGRTLADLARSIAVLETAGQVESDLAKTLRTMAAQGRGEAAARLFRLAEDVSQGARAAAERSEHLQQALGRTEHADTIALRHALGNAGTVLADLARAENRITRILTNLASCDSSDLAARCSRLAAEALAAAQHARDLVQAMHRLPDTKAGKP